MAKAKLSGWTPIEATPGVWTATGPGGRANLVRLIDGGSCLVSPIATVANTDGLPLDAKPIRYILAPNHFHNRWLLEAAAAAANAQLTATPTAIVRLEDVTGLNFSPLALLGKSLPPSIRLIEPDGLKNGEVWLRTENDGIVAWFVADTFFNSIPRERQKAPPPPPLSTENLRIARIFLGLGVRDRASLAAWLRAQLAADQPQWIVPCHGPIAGGEGLVRHIEQQISSILDPE